MYEPLSAPLADYATADTELLAEIDGTSYHRVELVIKRANGQYLGVYCDYRHWSQSAAGMLAHKESVIAFQQEQINKLAERLAVEELSQERIAWLNEHNSRIANENLALRTAVAQLQSELTKALNGNARLEAESSALAVLHSAAVDARDQAESQNSIERPEPVPTIPCRYGCGKAFQNNHGRGAHEKKVHGAVWQDAPVPTSLRGDWRCQICYSNAHAQSVSHPDRCIRCAKMSQNGSYIKLEAAA